MKKIISILLSIAMVISISSCGKEEETASFTPEGTYTRDLAGTELNVFNWGEYISDGSEDSMDVNAEFEKLTGIKVNYTTFESNEAMYAKMKSEAVAYDVIIPSDYMIERCIKEDMLQKIDVKSLSNYKYIMDQYKGLYFDENDEYSVPYNVGMVGLIYNTEVVTEKVDSWSIMWDEKYKDDILTFNNPRDAFAIAQFLNGTSLNSTDKADWDAAADKLKEQSPLLQARVMDEIFNKMEQGNASIAPYYAGDYIVMKEANDSLEFCYPKEGTNIFVDSICVPKNAKNLEAAMLYINFLMEPEVALANAEYIMYATPNQAVLDNPEYSLKDSEILYPKTYPKTEYFHDIDPDVRSYYESLWEEILR